MLRQVLSAGNWHMPRQAGDEEGTTTKTSLRGGWIVGTDARRGLLNSKRGKTASGADGETRTRTAFA
ncbi:hypothetical protein, partial [Burkholderia cepacia]|uniref:hypothetical protein n=1 Tax=Burkholderia cepacia TaxID=292 RepID=UPI0019552921